jgi:phosphinothricin acetyltransferase
VIEIRLATAGDLGAINAIYNHYVVSSTCTFQEEASTERERRAWFEGRGRQHPVIVAMEDREVVGWGALNRFHARSAYRFTVENSLYVRADRQRRGIGRALLGDLTERAKALGLREIVALIAAEQAGSVALHRAAGFVEVGRLTGVGFKFGRWLDVVYMQWSAVST